MTPPPRAGLPSGSDGDLPDTNGVEPGPGGVSRGANVVSHGADGGGSGARADAGPAGAFRWVRDPLRGRPWPSWAAWPATSARGPRGWAKTAAGLVRDRWHRSLQLRVIGTTLAVSALVVAILGFFLMQQIASGLIANAEKQANAQLVDGMQQALSQTGVAAQPTSWGQAETVIISVSSELRSGSGPSSDYSVVVLVAQDRVPKVTFYGLGWTEGQSLAGISATLRDDVTDAQDKGDNTQTYQQPTSLAYAGGSVPALAVGIPLGNYYQLYYVFPQTKILQTLQLVQRTLLAGGLALVVLLALIASLVTRWVVVPVRRAADAAQRVSAGDLNERMEVHGSDDLAALATSFNEMAASLQDKLSELEDLSQVQRQFVSDVSHELRTPLTTIRIAADVLHAARDQLDRSASRSAELLQGQLERFEALLADLLEISRYDANAATLDAEPVDVCDLVRRSADVAQHLAEQRGARIEFRLPALPCVAEADRRRVERILRNLLVNAVEHGEGRDTVVTVAADRDAVAVAVRDHGVGLKPGEDQLVFDRFWRADPARARTSGGTGLGLSIAQEDARLHGGWLEAWGECGRGSVFRLTLPRVAGAKLEGSPLPLRPDETELVTGLHALTAGRPVTLVAIAGLADPGDGIRDDDE